ncbi:MAG: C69 family dipeptidase [Thermotogota bacterium]
MRVNLRCPNALEAGGCTTLLLGKDATADGSVTAAFNSDGGSVAWLEMQPRQNHAAGTKIPIYRDWRRARQDIAAYVPQARATARVLGTDYLPCMNEHHVAMVMNACRSRRLLRRAAESYISHFQLMRIALERARSARDAVAIMGALVEEHGLLDVGPFPSGKNIGVIDLAEAWWFNAPGGHEWIAQRVPDDAVSVNANRFWLSGEGNPEGGEYLSSPGLIPYAVQQGWYDQASKRPFSFCTAYGDRDGDGVPSSHRVYSTLREWRVMSLAGGHALPEPTQGVEWAGPHFVVPRHKLSLLEVLAILRDHYEGTPFDTTRPENGGGVYGCPHPPFAVPTPYPRPIDMFNTQLSYVAQARGALQAPAPDVVWFSFHSPSTGCYVPLFPAADALPEGYDTGDPHKGAFWKFFSLGALARHGWSLLYPAIREAYDALEREWIDALPDLTERVAAFQRHDDEGGLRNLLARTSGEAAARALATCETLTLSARAQLAELLMQETLDEPASTADGR